MRKPLICGGVLVGFGYLLWWLGMVGSLQVPPLDTGRAWRELNEKGANSDASNIVPAVSSLSRKGRNKPVDIPSVPSFGDAVVERDWKFGTPRFVGRRSGYLSPPNPGVPPEEVLKAFLASNGRAFTLHHADILDATHGSKVRDVVTRHSGMRSVTWQQQRDELDIFGARMSLNLNTDGRIINVQSTALSMECVQFHDKVKVTADEAEAIALGHGDATSPVISSHVLRPPSPIWFPLDMVAAVKAWDIMIERPTRHVPHATAHRLIIRADTGEIVEDICLTYGAEAASYRVFADDSPRPVTPGPTAPTNHVPPEVTRELVTVAAISPHASPLGWIPDGTRELSGNNAAVYADRDDNDQPDSTTLTGTAYRVFDYPCDLSFGPSYYIEAALVQAFWRVNWFHDQLWELGFDEPAGNFQSDNFGRGGVASDPLRVEVQNDADAGGLHGIDAWYTGWGDGSAGKIQVGVATAAPRLDGALDSQLLMHEATHGVSSRLIGNGFGITTTQSRGLAEGWSDFLALALLSQPDDPLDGCYPFASYAGIAGLFANNGPYYFGIRRFPYSTNMAHAPQTLADADPNQIAFDPAIPRNPDYGAEAADQIHNLGEIWCLALWECRANLIARHGYEMGNGRMLRLVVDGMKLAPENPTFLEARNALLQADLVAHDGVNQVDLWRGFAKRGMGYGAEVPGSVATAGIVERFGMPFGVAWMVSEVSGDGDGYVEPGESGKLQVGLESFEMGLSNAEGRLSYRGTEPQSFLVVQSNVVFGAVAAGGSATGTPELVFSVDAGFPGNSNACLTLAVDCDQGQFEWPVDVRIGNPYDYPPNISDVVVAPGTTNAVVSWRCNIEGDGLVRWGGEGSSDRRTHSSQSVDLLLHEATLLGLEEGVFYDFVVEVAGTNGLTNATATSSFRTYSYIYVDATSTATQDVGTVAAPFRSLQAAADAAKLTGDQIRMAGGTYTGTHPEAVLNMVGSDWDITIRGGYGYAFSTNDPAQFETVIDGEMTRRGIRLDEGAALSIQGVTITRGSGEWGGGVHVRMSQFNAEECVISGNASTNGINEFGGGLYATLGAAVVLHDVKICRNSARRGGGGFAVSDTTYVALVSSVLDSNYAFHTGGGFYVQGGARADIFQFVCAGNKAGFRGGGIDVAPYAAVEATYGTIADNLVTRTASEGGLGGGGISVSGSISSGTLLLNSSVLWGNLSDLGADLLCAEQSEAYVTRSCIGDLYGALKTSEGVISEDPQFAAPLTGDFHLLPTSPCIDVGSTNVGSGLLDMDGEPRPFGSAMEIGADEYVDADTDGMADYWEQLKFDGLIVSDGTSDGDTDGLADLDEYLNQTDPAVSDTDGDDMPDGWEVIHVLDPRNHADAVYDSDGDMQDNRTEYISDTNPNDPSSWLGITNCSVRNGLLRLGWQGGQNVFQILEWSTNITVLGGWQSQQSYGPPTTRSMDIVLPLSDSRRFYRVRAVREEP